MFTNIYANWWNKENLMKELSFSDRYDLSGRYFDHVLVKGFTVEVINNENIVTYDCECICGKKVKITRHYLTHSTFSGHCGCMTNRNRLREIEKAFTKRNKKNKKK